MLAATFAVVFIALYAGHQVGDHWVNAAPAVSAHSRVSVEVAR